MQTLTVLFKQTQMMYRLIMVLVPILEHFILGEECQSFYTTQSLCDTIYGSTLSTYTQMRSLTECTVQCSLDELCLSVIYVNGSGDCRTNTGILVTPDTGCLETVWYASLLQVSINGYAPAPNLFWKNLRKTKFFL